jgi:hypothetical protein
MFFRFFTLIIGGIILGELYRMSSCCIRLFTADDDILERIKKSISFHGFSQWGMRLFLIADSSSTDETYSRSGSALSREPGQITRKIWECRQFRQYYRNIPAI